MEFGDGYPTGEKEVRGPVTGGDSVTEYHEDVSRAVSDNSQQLVWGEGERMIAIHLSAEEA